MSDSTSRKLRRLWFQIHKWIGLSLAILIIPISLTGSAIVWHDWVDEALNPERSANADASRPASFYAVAAQRSLPPGAKLISLTYPDGAGAVVVTASGAAPAAGARPVRTLLYLDPTTGAELDRAQSNEGLVQVMHRLHGSLMVPGVGRQIVGWIGVAMLLSSLTGLWLWWPRKGGIGRGLRWKRSPDTSGKLHHQGGFWICIPLAVLSFTGAWISFPAFFAALSGDPAGPSPAERMRRMAAAPISAPVQSVDTVLSSAAQSVDGRITTISWPTEPDAKWKVSLAGEEGLQDVSVDDRSGTVAPPKTPAPETTARLMRRLHDGTGTGPVWQTIIFIGGLIPAALAVTGILMWLNARRRRAGMLRRHERREAAIA
jgi:uncharacterized iron-regulated membrane protein